ncbi:protein sip-5, partial [Luteimonas sp. SJ-92]
MSIKRLQRRVERSELLVDGRITQTREGYRSLRRQWREAWSPGRIVVAGLLAGFAAGRSAPERAMKSLGRVGKQLGDPRWLRLISSIAGLLTSIQATVAAARAKDAAQTADDAADNAQEANEEVAAGAGSGAPAAGTAGAGAAAARPAEGVEG